MSVEYLPPEDHLGDEELDELLDLAAELAAPEDLPAAWDRRARFTGGATMARLLHGGLGTGDEEQAEEWDGDEPPGVDLMRVELDDAFDQLDYPADDELSVYDVPQARNLPALVFQRSFIPIPWRKPLAVSGGLLLVGLVGGILFHTLGPDNYSSAPFTAPQALLGPAANGSGLGALPSIAPLPNNLQIPSSKVVIPALGLPGGSGGQSSSSSVNGAGASSASAKGGTPPNSGGGGTVDGPDGGGSNAFNPFPGTDPDAEPVGDADRVRLAVAEPERLAEPDADPDRGTDTDAHRGTHADAERGPDAHPGADADPDRGTDADAHRGADADPGAHADAHRGTDADPGAHADAHRGTDADPGADAEADPGSHADPGAHPGADPGTDGDADGAAEADAQADPGTDAGADRQADADPGTDADPGAHGDPGADAHAGADPRHRPPGRPGHSLGSLPAGFSGHSRLRGERPLA